MNKILKYGLLGTGAVASIAVVGVAYVVATFNPNVYKPQIIQAVKDSKQRNLRLDGDIKLSFFPNIGANLSKVSLSEFKSEKEFAAIDSARVSLAFLPLLRKQVVVNEVAVSGLNATLVKHKDGTTNIDDLLAKEEPKKKEAAKEAGLPVKFDIASVSLDKTSLAYRDEGSGVQYAAKDLSLKTGRIAIGVPAKIELSAGVQANQPKLDITVQLKTTLTFDLDRQKYQLQGLELQAGGLALDISSLKVKAGGDVSADLTTQEFGARKFALNASGIKGKDKFEAALDAPALSLTQDKYSGDKIALNARLEAAFGNVAASLALPGVEGDMQSFKLSALTLDLDVKQPEQAFKIKFISLVSGNFKTQQFNLGNLSIAVIATGDKLPNKTVSSEMKGSVQLDVLKQNVQANLAGGLLQSKVKIKAGVNGFEEPAITFEVDVDQFDADLYLPKASTAEAPKAKEPEQPFDLSALRKLKLDGSLRVGALKAANIKASQLRVDVKARDGKLNVNPLSVNLYQGSAKLSASVNATPATPNFAVNGNLSGVNIAPLLKDVMDLDIAEGKGNITLNLTTQGNMASSLKKSLNGSLAVNLADGAIKGINLTKLVQNVQKLGKGSGIETLGVNKDEKTEFSEFKASFKVVNGVAHNDDLAVKAPILRIVGNGDIDVGNDSLSYTTKVTVSKTEGGGTATLPVYLNGPFTSLKYKVDYGALIKDVIKQKAEAKVDAKKEEVKAKAQEQLKNKLKGLFK